MEKRILTFIFFIVVSINIVGCTTSCKPELTITIDKAKIDVIKVKKLPNNNKDIFKPAFKEGTAQKIKHVKIGEKVTLNFGNNTPGKMTIEEIFLNNNGETLYSDIEIKDISFIQEDDNYLFTIEKSIISGLSSGHLEGKTDLRGYKITTFTGKGEDMEVYIFVIRTDAE